MNALKRCIYRGQLEAFREVGLEMNQFSVVGVYGDSLFRHRRTSRMVPPGIGTVLIFGKVLTVLL